MNVYVAWDSDPALEAGEATMVVATIRGGNGGSLRAERPRTTTSVVFTQLVPGSTLHVEVFYARKFTQGRSAMLDVILPPA